MRLRSDFQHLRFMYGVHVSQLSSWQSVLPFHVAERTRLVSQATEAATSGRYVLYWMRCAQRVHENPALDAACSIAASLGLGVVVYHGLSTRYPFPSMRTHRFILDGAKDVQSALVDTPLRHVFHLARKGDRAQPLLDLAQKAACVVAEDLPLPWYRAQTRSLAERSPPPLLVVDTACVFPMAKVEKTPTRAFAFRKKTDRMRMARVAKGWPSSAPLSKLPAIAAEAVPTQNAFNPLRDEEALQEALFQCDIDHGIPAVPDTPGGAKAGYQRWEQFRQNGLAQYHRRRNDAMDVDGVSRMSAYLHFGQVSPFRLAHQAFQYGGPGAEKYLDELLIWRELSYAFCDAMCEGGEGLEDLYAWLPNWAQEELASHADDERPAQKTWDELARAQSDSDLWNAAQTSLLRQGELHNNLRMTWAKAIPLWTATPKEALSRLIDLNDRYALDGRDPSSIGGLFWALGLFDRPFSPATPVLGSIRSRSPEAHEARMDLAAYRRHCERRQNPAQRILVVGSGIAGLVCARTLRDQGHEVEVWDKGRGVGGRTATRRIREADIAFDLGAQFFVAQHPLFYKHVEAWAEKGWVAHWRGRFGKFCDGRTQETSPPNRYVAQPGMRSLAEELAAGLSVHQNARVTQLDKIPGAWRLQCAEDATPASSNEFDVVVLTMPPEQAYPLIEAHSPALAQVAANASSHAVYALGLSYPHALPIDFDALEVKNDLLTWVARDSSKPGRPKSLVAPERWVLHASPAFSASRADISDDEVIKEMQACFFRLIGMTDNAPPPLHTTLQRWRLARAAEPIQSGPLYDSDTSLGLCGDWLNDGTLEGAFLSGRMMAGRVLASLPAKMAAAKTDSEDFPQR